MILRNAYRGDDRSHLAGTKPGACSERGQLLLEIDEFLAETRMSASQLGHNASGNPHCVKRLRENKETRQSSIDALRAYMASVRSGVVKP